MDGGVLLCKKINSESIILTTNSVEQVLISTSMGSQKLTVSVVYFPIKLYPEKLSDCIDALQESIVSQSTTNSSDMVNLLGDCNLPVYH